MTEPKQRTKIQILIKERNWRLGAPKNGVNVGKKAVIVTFKNEMDWDQLCLLNHMITHDEFFELKTKLCIVDLENIRNLQNPETPFLIKDLLNTIQNIDHNFPRQFLKELRSAVVSLIDKMVELGI